MPLTTTETDFLLSLSDSDLFRVLQELPTAEQAEVLSTLASRKPIDERDADNIRKQKKRKSARDITIPPPAEPSRRNECLGEPELFLRTYFADTFSQPFTGSRREMLRSIIDAAMYGGDYAVAAPRGEGKTRLALYGAVYLMLSGLSSFPIVIGKSQIKAQNELKTIKEKLQQSELLIADFPEVGVPFREVGGWSSRARLQTAGGSLTNIELAADHIIFPTITRDCLDRWPSDCEPCSRGQIMSSLGVDGPIRGTNYRDRRPTLAILDDIESKQTADSDTTIEANQDIIEKDVGGLGPNGTRVSRVMLCTTQNRKCVAYMYTDRKQKPSWKGVRFRSLVTPPDRVDLWDEYIEMRQGRTDDDPDAREAHWFYLNQREAMDAGAVVGNEHSYDTRPSSDGDPIEVSALQAYYNRVADFGRDAVATEYDNDPPPPSGPDTSSLTAELIMGRMSGLERRQVPAGATVVTVGVDVGKYACHWVMTAWGAGAAGTVIDYGVIEVAGTSAAMDDESSEPAIFRALAGFRDELLATELVDASGGQRKVSAVFVDSGSYTTAVYEFIRQVGGSPFFAAKGVSPYYPPTANSEGKRVGKNLHCSHQPAEKLWLYNLHTDFWKRFVHERFLTPTFDENNNIRRGSLSLFYPEHAKRHLSYAKHITAEMLCEEFKEGKGTKVYWRVLNRNNHWLDATYMAAAAASLYGIDVLDSAATIQPVPAAQMPRRSDRPKQRPQQGRFKQRPGGWVQGVRNR